MANGDSLRSRRSRLGLVVLLGVVLAGREASAQLACGGDVGPGETVTLTADVGPCDGSGFALTVNGGTLDLGGHALICADTNGDGSVPDGIEITGKKATVRNGSVRGCDTGLAILGSGKSTVEGVTATACVNDGLGVASDKNKILNNVLSGNGEDGIDLIESAAKNKVSGNTCSNNADEGIDLSGDKNKISLNTINANGTDGIDASTGARKNKIVANVVMGNGGADLQHSGGSCKANSWKKNSFGTRSADCLN